MSDFYSGVVVVMQDDLDEEKIKRIVDTISMIKGVIDVKPIDKEKTEQRIAKSRIKNEIMQAIEKAVKDL